jgi:hypothetical protein
MKQFNSILFRTTGTKDFDVEARFGDIQDYLAETFNNDYDAMVKCKHDYYSKLDAGDTETEQGNHKWIDIEMQINVIAFEGADWLYYQNSPHVEIHI